MALEDLILVTGCDRTRSWTNVAFLGSQVDARVSFGVKVVDGPNSIVNFQFSPGHSGVAAMVNPGPEGMVRGAPFANVKRSGDSLDKT